MCKIHYLNRSITDQTSLLGATLADRGGNSRALKEVALIWGGGWEQGGGML